MRTKVILSVELLVLLLTVSSMLAVVPATTPSSKTLQSEVLTGCATIVTDKGMYSLNGIVIISGWVFTPATPITVTVSRPDVRTDSWNDVTANSSGAFVTSYPLDGVAGVYNVTATDGINTAETSFGASAVIIWTDKSDYESHETVTIFGSGFDPNGAISVTVLRPDKSDDTWAISADAVGDFTTTYLLDGITGTYDVTATDGTREASTWFTDASLTLSPTSGAREEIVTVVGTGFWTMEHPPFPLGTVYFDGHPVGQFSASGSFSTSFPVPEWAVEGKTYTVSAKSGSIGSRILYCQEICPLICFPPIIPCPCYTECFMEYYWEEFYASATFTVTSTPIATPLFSDALKLLPMAVLASILVVHRRRRPKSSTN